VARKKEEEEALRVRGEKSRENLFSLSFSLVKSSSSSPSFSYVLGLPN
jgi:hypothetical protein